MLFVPKVLSMRVSGLGAGAVSSIRPVYQVTVSSDGFAGERLMRHVSVLGRIHCIVRI